MLIFNAYLSKANAEFPGNQGKLACSADGKLV